MRRTRHQVLAEFRTAEILSAAAEVFGEKGFAKATVEDIAREAGIAKGTVYLYFSSKEELYRAAFARYISELKDLAIGALRSGRGVEDAIRAFVDTKLAYLEEHVTFFSVYQSEAWSDIGRGAGLQESIEASAREQIAELVTVLTEAMESGIVRCVPAEAAARAVFDLTRAVIRRRLRGEAADSTEHDAVLATDLLWKGLAVR